MVRPGTVLVLALLLITVVPVAWAGSGHVVDHEGKPLAGVSVCTVAANVDILCVETDSEGFYSLPPGGGDKVRIRAPGYLIEKVADTALEEPVRLRPAAKLEVSFVDEAGTPLSGVSFFLSRPNGRRHGPLGPTNRTGIVIVNTLEPGEVVISASGEGYADGHGHRLELKGGETATITVRLVKD